ncbi:MAG: cysteine desulfurase [Candidatus Melainabacteria bacterium]|nr:cysteine desulfurase [Candidatus Melainabacteria bacterium]
MYNKKMIYADHSATTQARPEVIQAVVKVLEEDFGNPSSIHFYGRKAKEHLTGARTEVASVINAKEEEIIFTSGGTEADNIVIFGIARSFEALKIKNKDKHIISTKIEHPAIKEPLEYLEKKGWRITWLNVDKEGFIDLNELRKNITKKTLLVSIIHANNEIGTIQDLKEISKICKENNVSFHADAVQSFGKIPINVKELNIDFMSMSGHKIYGPKGVGALYLKSKDFLEPLIMGGGQESNLRPGTENLAGIVGFGVASKLLKKEINENATRLRKLQTMLIESLSKIKGIILTGSGIENRIPGHVSICCKDVEGESLVLQMDLKGIACSSGSACKSHNEFEPSHVLLACGISKEYVKGSLRLTLGRENTKEDINYIVESIKDIVNVKLLVP